MTAMSRPPINLTQKNYDWHLKHGSEIGQARITPHPDQTPHANQKKESEDKIWWMIEIEVNGEWKPVKVRGYRNYEIKRFSSLDKAWEWLRSNKFSPELHLVLEN